LDNVESGGLLRVSLVLRANSDTGHALVIVEDNGPVVPLGRIEELTSMLDSDAMPTVPTGLANIHYRLRLCFPETDAAVLLDRSLLGGLSVSLRIPVPLEFISQQGRQR
jgi:sensor histidine kinase YesM